MAGALNGRAIWGYGIADGAAGLGVLSKHLGLEERAFREVVLQSVKFD